MKQIVNVTIEREIKEDHEQEFIKKNQNIVKSFNRGIESKVTDFFCKMLDINKKDIKVEVKVVE